MTDTTTQPDPQVVARMREHLCAHPSTTLGRLMADLPEGITRDEFDRAYEAVRKPATVADIPAGRGAASLFIDRRDLSVWFKAADGELHCVYRQTGAAKPGEAVFAVHLGATLPAIDTTEESK